MDMPQDDSDLEHHIICIGMPNNTDPAAAETTSSVPPIQITVSTPTIPPIQINVSDITIFNHPPQCPSIPNLIVIGVLSTAILVAYTWFKLWLENNFTRAQ